MALPAAAQAPAGGVLIVDQQRLFVESRTGQAILVRLNEAEQALAQENRRIEAELEAEEQDLTRRRGEMSPEDFAPLAAEFDARVNRIRAEQSAKEEQLQRDAAAAEAAFFERAVPILRELLNERGGGALLDRRLVLLVGPTADITPLAIERIDAAAQ